MDEQAHDLCADSRARLDAEYRELPKLDFSILHLVHLTAVMFAACARRDFEWAFARLDELWIPYQRSVVHRGAFFAYLAHTTHARLVLNHHVETRATGDAGKLVQSDLAQLARLPSMSICEAAIARTRARVAFLRGEPRVAIQLLRESVERLDKNGMLQEFAHDAYALGLLLGGAEGAQLVASARNQLTGFGVKDPDAAMRTYVPELMSRPQ